MQTTLASHFFDFIREQLKPYQPASEPQPLRMHWTCLLILSIGLGYFTGALFVDLWLVLQANWIRRATGRTMGLQFALWSVGVDLIWLLGTLVGKLSLVRVHEAKPILQTTVGLVDLVMIMLYLLTIFTMRSDMEDEPIGLAMGGGMTFLFGAYYFQYWLQDYVFVRLTAPKLGVPAPTSPQSQA